MILRLFAVLLSFGVWSACATGPHPTKRSTASADGLFWIPHPCGLPATPFRKYSAFALDERSGVLYGRTGENTERNPIKDKPAGRVAWDSVSEFFEAKGLYAACAGAPAVRPSVPRATPAPAEPAPAAPVPASGGSFRAPVQADAGLYYKNLFRAGTAEGLPAETAVQRQLHFFLANPHLQAEGRADEVVSACPAQGEEGVTCVAQRRWTYEEARKALFGSVDLRQAGDGGYEVFDHYCQKWLGAGDFRDFAARSGKTLKDDELPGPGRIPYYLLVNTEHAWPQSKFTETGAGAEIQKTDLHHLFATDNKVNADRANWEFAEVDQAGAQPSRCGDGRLGVAMPVMGGAPEERARYFEPPRALRGDIARALFYFSVRYNAGMSPLQEYYLRKWNKEDAPDASEQARNVKIYALEGVRNPFVDDADLADRIPRFCRAKFTDAALPKLKHTYDCQ